MLNKKEKKAKEFLYRPSNEPKEATHIKGCDISNVDLKSLIKAYKTTGFQASHLGKAIDIIKKMRDEKATIYLGYTSNMITSGLREVIAYLVRKKYVHVLVTTAGGIEEDIMKTIDPFILGDFEADGLTLRERGLNRAGNIYIPNDRYIAFEKLLNKFLKKLYARKKIYSTHEFIYELGKEVNDKNSVYYWATKNKIPVFCPAITDGSIGDIVYFFKKECPDFRIDISDDIVKLNDISINAEKTGMIILGGGFVKHHICNTNMMREGADYAVYINTAQEFDGSDSGARPDEAVSWGKIIDKSRSVKVFADATIAFPIIASAVWGNIR